MRGNFCDDFWFSGDLNREAEDVHVRRRGADFLGDFELRENNDERRGIF